MKTPFFFLVSIVLLLGPTSGFSDNGGSDHVGGGGNVRVIDGKTRLRDLVDETTCRWQPGKDFAAGVSYLPLLMRSLEAVHPNLAAHVEDEIGTLFLCPLPGPLKKIDTSDSNRSVVQTDESGAVVAIRWDEKVFIDQNLFGKMDDRDQAYLFFHEVMHRFIAMNTRRRNQSLRSFVKAVSDNEKNPSTPEKFAIQAKLNSVAVPAIAPEQFAAFRVLRNPSASLSEKTAAFGSFDQCDATLAFLAPSMRNSTNRLAYQMSRALRGDSDRCGETQRRSPAFVAASSVDPEEYARILCQAENDEQAVEIDRILFPNAHSDAMGLDEWLEAHAYFWRNAFNPNPYRKRAICSNSARFRVETIEKVRIGEALASGMKATRLFASYVRSQGSILPYHGSAILGALFLDPSFKELSLRAVFSEVDRIDTRHSIVVIITQQLIASENSGFAVNHENFSFIQMLADGATPVLYKNVVLSLKEYALSAWPNLVRKTGLPWKEVLKAHLASEIPFMGVLEAGRAFGYGKSGICSELAKYKQDLRGSLKERAERLLRGDCPATNKSLLEKQISP